PATAHEGPQPPRQAADAGGSEEGHRVHRGVRGAAHMKMGKSTREAFGLALAKLGEEYPDVVVVDGDVHNSTRTDFFEKKFPQRFFNVGIAESDLVGVAGGLAAAGKRAWRPALLASSCATLTTSCVCR